MPGLSAMIRLNDRMTATLDRINEATNRVTNSWRALDNATSSGFEIDGVDAICKRLDYMNGSIVQIIESQRQHTSEVNKTASATDGLLGKLKTIASGVALGAAVKKTLELSDSLTMTTARLDMMNYGVQTTDELFNMVYQAAQRARGSLDGMADVVARFGNNARDAFSSNEEVVKFAEIVQKQMTIAGASTTEASNAMLQLSQALGSGVLRGDELNSIFEQAPNLIRSIANYMDVPIGQIRELASEGKISASVVKNAIFASSDEVNKQFEQMPMTFGQIWQKIQNTGLVAFQPVLNKVNEIANSERFQAFVNASISAITTFSNVALEAFNAITVAVQWLSDNISWIAPVVGSVTASIIAYKVAVGVATAAQWLWNSALLACPVTWIVLGILAFVAALVLLCQRIAQTSDVADSTMGVIAGSLAAFGAFVWNTVTGVINAILQAVWSVAEPVISLIEWVLNAANGGFNSFGDAVKNLIGNIIGWFLSLGQIVTKIIDAIFGTNWTAGLEDLRQTVTSWGKNENAITLSREAPAIQRIDYENAFNAGVEWGDNLTNKLQNTFSTDALTNAYDNSAQLTQLEDIKANTAAAAKSIDIANEDLKYMRDIAERDVINKFTTAEVKVNLGGVNNNVSANTDLDGMISYLAESVSESLEIARERAEFT